MPTRTNSRAMPLDELSAPPQAHPQSLTAADIQAAVAAGMREAFRDQAFTAGVGQAVREQFADSSFWAAVSDAMQRQARHAAGGWLLGSLAVVMRKVLMLALIGLIVYQLAGVPGVVALIKSPPP